MKPEIRQNPAASGAPGPGLQLPLVIPGLSSGPKMSDAVFTDIRDFIYGLTGIYFQDSKKYLLEGRLGKRLQILGMNDFSAYLHLLRYGNNRAEEMKSFYDAITIN